MPATDTKVAEVEKMFKVNVFGPMRIVHYMHPFLIEAKGVIVNIGSIGGVCPYVYGASYNASKAALHHYGNTLRVEMRPFGYGTYLTSPSCGTDLRRVRVVNIISGEVHTNILKNDHGRSLPEGKFNLLSSIKGSSNLNRVAYRFGLLSTERRVPGTSLPKAR